MGAAPESIENFPKVPMQKLSWSLFWHRVCSSAGLTVPSPKFGFLPVIQHHGGFHRGQPANTGGLRLSYTQNILCVQ